MPWVTNSQGMRATQCSTHPANHDWPQENIATWVTWLLPPASDHLGAPWYPHINGLKLINWLCLYLWNPYPGPDQEAGFSVLASPLDGTKLSTFKILQMDASGVRALDAPGCMQLLWVSAKARHSSAAESGRAHGAATPWCKWIDGWIMECFQDQFRSKYEMRNPTHASPIHFPKTMRVGSLYCWVFKRETLKISVVLIVCTSRGTVVWSCPGSAAQFRLVWFF